MKVLVTGANGFLGSHIFASMSRRGTYDLVATSRSSLSRVSEKKYFAKELDPSTDWSDALQGVDVVIHCGGTSHLKNARDSVLEDYKRVNRDGSLELARQAASYGVKKFIFLSSVNVLGRETRHGARFFFDSPAYPEDLIGNVKLDVESGLQQLQSTLGLTFVIIRLPLVYGVGAGGNFDALIRLVRSGIPLPFGGICNKRSLIGITNLCDLVKVCVDHPNAKNRIFLASDGFELSTPELIVKLAKASGKSVRLFRVPCFLIKAILVFLGKGTYYQSLCGSFEADIQETRKVLGWEPSLSIDEELRLCFD